METRRIEPNPNLTLIDKLGNFILAISVVEKEARVGGKGDTEWKGARNGTERGLVRESR